MITLQFNFSFELNWKQECKPKAKRQARRAGKAPQKQKGGGRYQPFLWYGANHDDIVTATALPSSVERDLTGILVEKVEESPDAPTGRIRVGTQVASSSSSTGAALDLPHQRMWLGAPNPLIQREDLICIQCVPTVVTVGIRTCGLNCGATFCKLHSHSRSIRGQSVLVFGYCVTTHPTQLPKLYPRMLFTSHESEKRSRERDPPPDPSGGGSAAGRFGPMYWFGDHPNHDQTFVVLKSSLVVNV
eukprot:4990483-Amphidinium_carterae.1